MIRSTVLFVFLAIGASSPIVAQQDFWAATGRFISEGRPLADLSGTYQAEGSFAGEDYSVSLDVSRWKTLKTPAGGKFDLYRTTYDWGESQVKGIAVLLGNRFYLAYGSENLSLFVGAPFNLSEDERAVFARYRDLRRQADAKNAGSSNTVFSVKGAPWFANLYSGEIDQVYPAPAYYALWVGAWGGYGHDFFRDMPKFAEGRYSTSGDFLRENGEEDGINSHFWEVSNLGELLKIARIDDPKNRAKDVTGTVMPLADGTIVMLLGGNDDCGVIYYDVKNKTLVGPYVTQNGKYKGIETLTPSASVLSKNQTFFEP